MSLPGEIRAMPTEPQRLAYLDISRAVAICLMVLAHFSDSFLSEAFAVSGLVQVYTRFRGITAPVFFVVSGWAFAYITLPRRDFYVCLGPELRRRLQRAAMLFLWGYALTLPWWAEGFPFDADPDVWVPTLTFGVLQCIGTALLLAHALVKGTPGPRSFAAIAFAAAALTAFAAPWLQAWGATLPEPFVGMLSTRGFAGGFPIAPNVAYFFVGCGAGALALLGRWPASQVAWLSLAAAAATFAAGVLVEPYSARWASPELGASVGLGLFLRRLGASGLVIALGAIAARLMGRVPTPVAVLGRYPLTFYVGHMLVLWGVPGITGLVHRLSKNLSLLSCALLAGSCLAAIGAAIAIARCARRRLARAFAVSEVAEPR